MDYLGRILFLMANILAGCSAIDNQDHAGIIITADWLQAEMNNPSLVMLHVGTEEVYDSIHIPGSLFIDPYEFTVSGNELRNQLPDLDSIRVLLGSVGVDKDSRIVLYSESDRLITRTARVFLTLDHAGLGNRSHMLNGGLDAWFAMDQESNSKQGNEKATGVTDDRELPSVTDEKKVTIMAHELNQQRWDPEYVIVDARSAEEYFGEIDSVEWIGTRGHIEGAYFMDYHLLLSDSNPQLIKDDDELLKEFKKAGLDRDKTAVFYCGSGVRASLSYLVARHLGYPALLYDGSIEEWEDLGLPQTSPVIDPLQTK